MSSELRIVKVGGSLLELGNLAERLRGWLAEQRPARNVLLAGGGPMADQVRRWDKLFHLGEVNSHWICLDVLDATARLLGALLPEAQLCWDYDTLSRFDRSSAQTMICAPSRILHEQESQFAGTPLPHSWEATTDSIAARVAEMLEADELVLLKSALPAAHATLAELGGTYVDTHFHQAAASIARIRFVNLREAGSPEVTILRQ